jgi:hypothetical protein
LSGANQTFAYFEDGHCLVQSASILLQSVMFGAIRPDCAGSAAIVSLMPRDLNQYTNRFLKIVPPSLHVLSNDSNQSGTIGIAHSFIGSLKRRAPPEIAQLRRRYVDTPSPFSKHLLPHYHCPSSEVDSTIESAKVPS